jgi:hypothetical protein
MAGAGPLAPIKAECQKINEKWPGQITFKKEGQPFPVGVTRNIPAPPEAAAWDVYDIQVKMVIAGRDPADLAVWVEIPMPSLPSSLTNRWAAELEKKWKTTLKDPRAKGKGWLLSMVFQFAEKRYLDFLKMDPSVVDTYSAAGASLITFIARTCAQCSWTAE